MTDAENRLVEDTIMSLELEGAAARRVKLICEQLYGRGIMEGMRRGEEIFVKSLERKKNKKGLSK